MLKWNLMLEIILLMTMSLIVLQGKSRIYDNGRIGTDIFTKAELISIRLAQLMLQHKIDRSSYRDIVRFVNTIIWNHDESLRLRSAMVMPLVLYYNKNQALRATIDLISGIFDGENYKQLVQRDLFSNPDDIAIVIYTNSFVNQEKGYYSSSASLDPLLPNLYGGLTRRILTSYRHGCILKATLVLYLGFLLLLLLLLLFTITSANNFDLSFGFHMRLRMLRMDTDSMISNSEYGTDMSNDGRSSQTIGENYCIKSVAGKPVPLFMAVKILLTETKYVRVKESTKTSRNNSWKHSDYNPDLPNADKKEWTQIVIHS
ncbi:hypothetical protein PHYBLDRAFT_67300 [Phycomyces blakesleeanus NRRL 1555(-)]|uniref:Uncharacterized protein n=1 Tax=Phycomyces blakesleeanus (strain ATCC 8743b / DSM 1359 / FGSC 10004 / NBRC 33097 / NRRL 1555) TaxID=763407 RepID=A0A167K2Y4_PHYB8|nr:hypothetical protein PHYBLDRAFT_67300 [Phycomyces blakesleeanus NRRL 1555(-)]OAD67166.1 hypothetical protein PHYBLDRAFT_67300 [Phycomyces blakesleeanus NRRL 1555(-)]|eukprot:XP_018285206.1 hypothetical protein PHYBLDRAFT_67300 [Phycomyces blakesleeanus NRRL 1555(-)]